MAAVNYNYDAVAIMLDGVLITGLVAGEGLSVSFAEDSFVTVQGSHGLVVRSKRPNNVARATLRVQQGAPILDYLQTKQTLDDATGLAPFTFAAIDAYGRSSVLAPRAWFVKAPDLTFGTEPGPVEFMIELANPVLRHGGNNPA